MIKFKGLFKVGAFVLALLALMVISSNGAKAQYSGTNGRIFFVGGDSHLLYSIFPDSSDLYSHGDMEPCTRFLSVSPTAATVAITRIAGTCRTYTRSVAAGANSQTPTALTNTEPTHTHFRPSFSPDGTKIAYLSTGFTIAGDPDHCDKQLYVANANGSGTPVQLTDFNFGNACEKDNVDSGLNYPVWSNDSEKIYMHYKVYDTPVCPPEDPCDPATGTLGLLWINANDSTPTLNTYVGNIATGGQGGYAVITDTTPSSNAYNGNGMDISPSNNSNIVYANDGNIYTQPLGAFTNPLADTATKITNAQTCANGTQAYYSPYYSPDGQYIVAAKFCGPAEANSSENAIVIMKADGSEERVLIKNSNLANYIVYGYTVPFWSNITTTYNSTPTPSPTPAAPDTSGSIFKQRDIRLPMMLVLMGLVVLSASGYGLYKEAKRRKKI